MSNRQRLAVQRPRHDPPRDLLDEVIAGMFGKPRASEKQEIAALRKSA